MQEKTITFLLCPQMLATSVALPMEQLRAAQLQAKARNRHTAQGVKFLLASMDGKPVITHTGLRLEPDCAITDIRTSHISFLPALWRNPTAVLKQHRALYPWLVDQHRQGNIVAGVGTGCCLLGEAGLLDNRPATTHWYYFDEFEQRYPLALLKRHYFITQADNIFCAGSVTSLADLTVFFIEELFNFNIARDVERHFFHEIRQAYRLSHNKEGAFGHPDESIAQAQAWMHEHAQTDMQIKRLADNLKMSLRTFNRRFKSATNSTPLQYLQKIRMRLAGDLLQTSNLSIAEIAYKTGYQDTAHFTSLFKKHFATTPGQYRKTVRAKLFHLNQ